jgi:hypothetical protein
MLDLVLLTELCQRVSFCTDSDPEPQGFHTVLSLLSFLFKAPLVPPGSPVVNALFRQRSCIENIFRCAPGGRGGLRAGKDSLKMVLLSLHCPLQGLRGAPAPEPHAIRAQDGASRPRHQARRGGGHQPTALQERAHTCHQWLHRRCQWAPAGTNTKAVHCLNQVTGPDPSTPNASNHSTSALAKDNKASLKQASLCAFSRKGSQVDLEYAM